MTVATALAVEKAMVGQQAPDFNMASTKNIEKLNEDLKLSDFRGRWLVLLFYPLDFTFVCPTELCAFSDRLDEFAALDADVCAVSIDSQFTHLAWTRHPRREGCVDGVRMPLLADLKREMSSSF